MWIALFLLACSADEPAATQVVEEEAQTLPVPEQGYQLVTPFYEVPAYTEVDLCTVIRLEPEGDEKLYWVNRLESLVTEGTHHMNVLIGDFSFLDTFMGDGAAEAALGAEVGQYLCSELDTMELAYPIFPSQRTNQQITMPDGVAAPLTAPLLLIVNHHYVNTRADPISINATLNVETVDVEDVEQVAGMVFDDISDLSVPPGTDRVIGRTCVSERDVDVALVSTHNHQWGECATLNHYDGDTETVEADPFFVNKLWDQPPILHFEPGTFSLAAGDGVHWACHYRNDTDRTLVNDGTADGEMCVFAAVTYPSEWTAQEVEDVVASGDLGQLFKLLGEALGSCDTTSDTVESPWGAEQAGACSDLEQTESNVLD